MVKDSNSPVQQWFLRADSFMTFVLSWSALCNNTGRVAKRQNYNNVHLDMHCCGAVDGANSKLENSPGGLVGVCSQNIRTYLNRNILWTSLCTN